MRMAYSAFPLVKGGAPDQGSGPMAMQTPARGRLDGPDYSEKHCAKIHTLSLKAMAIRIYFL
jgi:hypothetical protein